MFNYFSRPEFRKCACWQFSVCPWLPSPAPVEAKESHPSIARFTKSAADQIFSDLSVVSGQKEIKWDLWRNKYFSKKLPYRKNVPVLINNKNGKEKEQRPNNS